MRIVRAVHGMANGKKELWLYVPEQANDKSNAQRKGWWLHPQPGKHRYYYIGPLEDIQGSKTLKIPDVAIFANFPFTRTVHLKNTQGRGQRNSACGNQPLQEIRLI